MMGLLSLFFRSFILAATTTTNGSEEVLHQIHTLRPHSGAAGTHVRGLSCLSWRLGVETHNVIDWKTVPEKCGDYVGHYMIGQQYRKDSRVVADEALAYVESLKLVGDGKDVWVFDIDETTLSNLPYYADHGFGVEKFNQTVFSEWIFEGKQLVLPESLKLYKRLVSLGIKIVFITGRTEDQRQITESNLKNVGYKTWEKLVLKGSDFSGKTAVEYKSSQRKKLVDEGYRIIGNMGDQWSDLLGTHVGDRTFKVPDPMYYIS